MKPLGMTDREILGLAIPALGTLAIDPLLTLADTAFVARLGTVELAALGVDAAILSFAFFAFNFLAYVVTPLVARALGRGHVDEARRWVGDALLLAVILGVTVMTVLLVLAPWFVDLMGADAEVAGPAISYLRIRAFADRLRNQGVEASVRRSRGLDINAACGQLRVEVERKRRKVV